MHDIGAQPRPQPGSDKMHRSDGPHGENISTEPIALGAPKISQATKDGASALHTGPRNASAAPKVTFPESRTPREDAERRARSGRFIPALLEPPRSVIADSPHELHIPARWFSYSHSPIYNEEDRSFAEYLRSRQSPFFQLSSLPTPMPCVATHEPEGAISVN